MIFKFVVTKVTQVICRNDHVKPLYLITNVCLLNPSVCGVWNNGRQSNISELGPVPTLCSQTVLIEKLQLASIFELNKLKCLYMYVVVKSPFRCE